MFCPNCGNEIIPGSKFCGICGFPVAAENGAAAQGSGPQPKGSGAQAAQGSGPQPQDSSAQAPQGNAPQPQDSSAQAAQSSAQPPKKKDNKGLIIGLAILGFVLFALLAVAAIAFILMARASTSSSEVFTSPEEIEAEIEEEIDSMIEEAVPGYKDDFAPEDEDAGPELEEVPAENEDILMEDAEASAAYLDILREHKNRIRGYVWQDDMAEHGWDDSGISISENRPVILEDIDGDGKKEMILLEAAEESPRSLYEADLHVFTFDGEAVGDAGEMPLDVQAGGGTYYMLFTVRDDPSLCIYKSWGDENWTDSFARFTLEDGILNMTDELSAETRPDENYEEVIQTYSENGTEISGDEFEARKAELIDSIDKVFCWNYITDEALAAKLTGTEPAAYTFNEALGLLKTEAGDLAEDGSYQGGADALSDEEAELWLEAMGGETRTFMFASGAGGWWTDIILYPDGTLKGNYHDSEMGDPRSENGVVYICEFEGRFSALTKVDDFTYSMTLEEITTAREAGEEWTDEGVLYIASEPYGFENAETFYLYLPGKETRDLPAEYLDWIRMPLGYSDAPELLTFYGIFNEKAGNGFFETKG